MRVAIIGSRNYGKLTQVMKFIDGLPASAHVVSGGATGVDTAAETYAKSRKLPFTKHVAKWKTYGNGAGRVRNRILVEDSDIVVAFWDGRSPGTAHAIEVANKRGKPVYICPTKEVANEIYTIINSGVAPVSDAALPCGWRSLPDATASEGGLAGLARQFADKCLKCSWMGEELYKPCGDCATKAALSKAAWAPDLPANQALNDPD